MQSLWQDEEAAQFQDDLGLRVYTSRLLGRDPSLVLHGGGNTSVKITEADLFGQPRDLLYVKGSGWDLVSIDRPGFTPVLMDHLLKLAELNELSDPQMVNELKTHQTVASAPTASVEAILHAVLPFKYVDHTHADAIVTITNTANGKQRIEEIYGNRVVIIDYIMPGFDLALQCARQFKEQYHEDVEGMILLNHGIFTFAETARDCYENMIRLVDEAEQYIKQQNAWDISAQKASAPALDEAALLHMSQLRKQVSAVAGRPMVLNSDRSESTMGFCLREDLSHVSQQGPATPDHVIRTKQKPMLGDDVNAFARSYEHYFADYEPRAKERKSILDKAPRVILDQRLGLLSAGKSAKEAAIVRDIYQHTMEVITRAQNLGGYVALSDQDIFDMEYWSLEQAKLKKDGGSSGFSGEVVLVTGAASGIGKACVQAFKAQGAAVVALDRDTAVHELKAMDILTLECDISDSSALSAAIEQAVLCFGGIDMLVLNAGVFPGGKAIADMDMGLWRQVMQVNLDANLEIMRLCLPFLKLAPVNGRVVIIGSKNVPAPGPGAAAYSASKAALTQLARVAALEWGQFGIRINTLHPDAVFDTGIWTEEVLQARAKHYGMSVQEYKTKNVLKTELSSHDVATLAVSCCGPAFAKTTAAQIPIDGGNDRVI